jgi:Cys-tRNA(Pro)/Cys-tRNA(Cys) deacylase
MTDPADAARLTGYVVGGISPFGCRRPLPVVVEEIAVVYDTIFVSGGRRGVQLEVAPADLIALTGAATADLVE